MSASAADFDKSNPGHPGNMLVRLLLATLNQNGGLDALGKQAAKVADDLSKREKSLAVGKQALAASERELVDKHSAADRRTANLDAGQKALKEAQDGHANDKAKAEAEHAARIAAVTKREKAVSEAEEAMAAKKAAATSAAAKMISDAQAQIANERAALEREKKALRDHASRLAQVA